MKDAGARGLKRQAANIFRSWVTRSLIIGAIATLVDLGFGLVCLKALRMGARLSAMSGVATGAAITFFANRYFAFKEKNPELAKPALRFIVGTAVAMLVHGQLVVTLRDHLGVPYVPAKMIADLVVFSVGQLLMMRYIVFRKRPQ